MHPQIVWPYIYLCLCFADHKGPLKVLQENNVRDHDCFYLFKLDSSVVCPDLQSQLSTGSIILIMSVKTVYYDTKTLNIKAHL